MISPNNTTFPHICPVNSVGKASCETLKYLLLALIGLSTLENKKVLEITAIGGSKSFCLFKKKKPTQNLNSSTFALKIYFSCQNPAWTNKVLMAFMYSEQTGQPGPECKPMTCNGTELQGSFYIIISSGSK